MSIKISKDEFNLLNNFQKEIHFVENNTEEITSFTFKKYKKSTWYDDCHLKLESQKLDMNKIIYKINDSFHFLLYTYMKFNTPEYIVNKEYKDKIRISLTYNVGTNIIESALLKDDSYIFDSFDSVDCDVQFGFFQKQGHGKRTKHEIDVGNINSLVKWTNHIHSHKINVKQPWFFSEFMTLALPLFYKSSLSRMEMHYTFKKNVISDILRIQTLSKGKWINVNNNKIDIRKYITIKNYNSVENPEVWGRYRYISDLEINFHKKMFNNEKIRSYYFKTLENCDNLSTKTYEDVLYSDLKSKNPCMAIFFMAQNYNSILNHNYSNYTTNTKNQMKGFNPIDNVTIKYGNEILFENYDTIHFSSTQPLEHFLSVPKRIGFNVHSYNCYCSDYDPGVGIVFTIEKRAKLECRIIKNIENDDEYDLNKLDIQNSIQSLNRDNNDITNFIFRVRLLVLKKLNIKEQNGIYHFEIE